MSPQRAEPDPNRWRVLPVCLAVGFVTTLDVSIVNVALPSIESSLDAGPTELQLVVAEAAGARCSSPAWWASRS